MEEMKSKTKLTKYEMGSMLLDAIPYSPVVRREADRREERVRRKII